MKNIFIFVLLSISISTYAQGIWGQVDSLIDKARSAIGTTAGNAITGRFKTAQECFNFLRVKAGSVEKMRVGAIACNLAFQAGSESAKKNSALGACIVNNYSEIYDDSSGTKVVSRCGELSGNPLSAIVAQEFSPSARMEKILEENRIEMQRNNDERKRGQDGPFIMNIDGRLKTCIRIGGILDCV